VAVIAERVLTRVDPQSGRRSRFTSSVVFATSLRKPELLRHDIRPGLVRHFLGGRAQARGRVLEARLVVNVSSARASKPRIGKRWLRF